MITLSPEIEKAVRERAEQNGKAPDDLVNETLRMALAADEPPARDEWEQRLLSIGLWTGISLTNEQVSSEGLYED